MQLFRKFDFIRRNRKRVINFTLPKRSEAEKKRNVDSVNAVGGNGRSECRAGKKEVDRYEICSHRPAMQKHDDGRWVPLFQRYIMKM